MSACCDAEYISFLSGVRRVRPRVLFIDDEPNVLDGARLALRSQRYEFRTARDVRARSRESVTDLPVIADRMSA